MKEIEDLSPNFQKKKKKRAKKNIKFVISFTPHRYAI